MRYFLVALLWFLSGIIAANGIHRAEYGIPISHIAREYDISDWFVTIVCIGMAMLLSVGSWMSDRGKL